MLHECGVYVVSPRGSTLGWREEEDFAEESASLATQYAIPHELLEAAEVRRRHPVIRLDERSHAYYEPSGGIVDPEKAVPFVPNCAWLDKLVPKFAPTNKS